MLETVVQLIQYRLIRISNRPFNAKDQVESVALFTPPSNSPGWNKYWTFTREGSFFPFPCPLVVQSSNTVRKPFHPHRGPLPLGESHFNSVLAAFLPGCFENFNNGLAAVNVNVPAADSSCLVVFHFLGNSTNEFALGLKGAAAR